ncbi:hypothetical protein SNE40_017990 [Patella caerulea]|uniref:Uncharacterized protein n=1 Tax=Patella caerulea TaxID=87958 RepID=A0AAN8PAQ0_PATCE
MYLFLSVTRFKDKCHIRASSVSDLSIPPITQSPSSTTETRDIILTHWSYLCPCGGKAFYQGAVSKELIVEIKAEIEKNLTVAKNKLSGTIRKKTSAKDERPSAVFAGYVGIVLILLSLGSLMLADMVSMIKFAHHKIKVLFYK